MIPRNVQNVKMRVNLSCPTCGMSLTDKKTEGYVLGNETYCCAGCAEGTGCTCRDVKLPRAKAGNRKGKIGQRNAENSLRDNNFNGDIDTSGRPV